MPNVAEIIKDHVTLEARCIDRLYRNAYIPRLQSGGGVVDFLVRACGQRIASPALLSQITETFKTRILRNRSSATISISAARIRSNSSFPAASPGP